MMRAADNTVRNLCDHTPPRALEGGRRQKAGVIEMDARMMLRVKRGDHSALTWLMQKYRAPLIHFIYGIVHDEAVAEDLTQDVFLRVFRGRKDYEPKAKFKSWIYRIGKNVAFNWLRDHSAEIQAKPADTRVPENPIREFQDQRPNVEDWLLYQVKIDRIRRAVGELPERQRVVVVMHRFEEMEHRQIASKLQCSLPAVKSLLNRAYTNLRVSLTEVGLTQ
jgi:RNA polymerase sigma-70 factor (ECF subfamily)